MGNNRIFKGSKDIDKLGQRLSEYADIKRYDDSKEKEGYALALCFHDLEESFRAYLDVHLPRLMKVMTEDLDDSELLDILNDIGQEFCHILYHIYDPKYFESMLPDSKGKL